jgi:3-oxoacyl-[acyl-carrier-protein] synthase-1
VDEEDAQEFAENVREGVMFDAEIPRLVATPGGNAGVLAALEPASAELAKGACEACVVGGVDSLLHSPYLDLLDTEGRLKTSATPAGLIPGEAAAFFVLETVAHARARQAPILAQLSPVRIAMERDSPAGQTPGRGQAMAQALRQAVADAPGGPGRIYRVINDLNGERWRFLEWALACNPALSALPPDFRLWHPADCFGDIGAATGAAHICLAVRAFARDYAVGDAILIANTSDTGERAALCVYPEPRRV